jgi:phosphate transport system substrate-binding protein
MVLGAVVPIYNVKGSGQNLNFTGEILAGIYLGKIRKWNDAQIKAANPGARLPDQEMVVFHRSDGSGTSYAWSEYLSKVSSEWKGSLGVGLSVRWPVGRGAEGSEGVASDVRQTANSIGYVEFTYALQHELSFGAVRNAAGEFIKADIASVTAAARMAESGDLKAAASITNAPGKNSYPIATYTWLLAPESGDKNTQAALQDLARWMLSSGQRSCSALGYAPLPAGVANGALQALAEMR